MRLLVCFVLLCCANFAFAEETPFRFGGQVSANSYRLDDPNGSTAGGSGVSIGALMLYELHRNGRLLLGATKESYRLAASSSNIGQDVTSIGGSLSYQQVWRLSRDVKPWLGAGLGYTSSSYRNRHMLTSSGLYGSYLADRDSAEFSWLLNGNIEWQIDASLDMGLQAQFSNSFNSNTNAFRLGVYVVY